METLYSGYALLILLTVAAGMTRVWRGTSRADQMQAALLFGTAGVAILLLLAFALDRPALVDVALVFALLAVIVSAAFVRAAWEKRSHGNELKEHDGGS